MGRSKVAVKLLFLIKFSDLVYSSLSKMFYGERVNAVYFTGSCKTSQEN